MPAGPGAEPGALDDLLGAAVAGAGVDRDRDRPVPGAVLARAVAVAAADRARDRSRRVFPARRPRRSRRCSCCACPSTIDGLRRLDRNAACRTGRPPPSPTRSRPRPRILSRLRCGAPMSSARCARPRPSRPARRCRGSRCAIRSRCARSWSMLVVATFFAAGGERIKRVAAAFDWQGVMVPANFRIDAWVTPPTYTGRPPVILPGLRPGEPVQTAPADLGAGRQHAGHPRDRQSISTWSPAAGSPSLPSGGAVRRPPQAPRSAAS